MLNASILDDLAACAVSDTQSITLDSANALQLCLIVSELESALVMYAINGSTIDCAIELARGSLVESVAQRNALEDIIVVALNNLESPSDVSLALHCSMSTAETILRVKNSLYQNVAARFKNGSFAVPIGELQ